jgi:choline-sulfatase
MKSLSLLLFAALVSGAAGRGVPAKRPDVIFIAIDDLNDWTGCLRGHPQAHTPHIDRLAARGTLFSNAHVQSPLCNPSRSSLLTGLRPTSTGIYGLEPGIRDVARTKDAVTLPQYFSRNGYATASFGKIFHDGSIPPAAQAGEFDEWGPQPKTPRPARKLVKSSDGSPAMIDWGIFPPDDRQQADWITADNAIRCFRKRDKNKPFFLAAGFRLPHLPCYASRKWFDLIPAGRETVLPEVKDGDRDDVPFFAWYLHWKVATPRLSWLRESDQWRAMTRSYLASTAFMDSQVGRLLDAVQADGDPADTVVVLWSDNGWHMGEKDITGKCTLWEPSTRVPLIFAGPGVAVGADCGRAVELLDVYPTLVELCGLPPKEGLEGHSLMPQLKDANAARRWPAITSHNQGNHAVRSDRWRFIRYADGSQELYDMRADPGEWNNLAADPKHAGTILELARWLPKVDLPPAPGSAVRILVKDQGRWLWEGKPILDAELLK